MEQTQTKQRKKGKNKGKGNVIKTPEELEKILSHRSPKAAASPERNCEFTAKKQKAASQKKPEKPCLSLAGTNEEASGDFKPSRNSPGARHFLFTPQPAGTAEGDDGRGTASQMAESEAATNQQPMPSSRCCLQTDNKIQPSNEEPHESWDNDSNPRTDVPSDPSQRAVDSDELAGVPEPNSRNEHEADSPDEARGVEVDDGGETSGQMVEQQQVLVCGPRTGEEEEEDAAKLEEERDAMAAEVKQLTKSLQKTKALHEKTSQFHRSRIAGLETQLSLQTKENNKLKTSVSQAQAKMQNRRDLEAYLAVQMDENNKLKAAMVQAQVEIQSWRDLEVYLAIQTEENNRLKAALVQAQAEIQHQHQWQAEMLRLHKCHSDQSKTLKEKEAALQEVTHRLHHLEEQLANLMAEREALAADVERSSPMANGSPQ